MFELFKAVGLGLMVLLPLVNPLTTVALFLSLSKNMTPDVRNQQARMASIYVFAIMMVTFYADEEPNRKKNKIKYPCKNKIANIAFVPLAMPSTAGPGTIAMIISWVSTVNEDIYFSSWIIWIALRSSSAIMDVIGSSGIEAISRLMGFLLVCMGVQFIINGVLEVINMENPLLSISYLPKFSLIRAEHILPAVQIALKKCRKNVSLILSIQSQLSWENLCQPFLELENYLNKIWSPIAHLYLINNTILNYQV
uniref:Uncharacterized protein n=1 Tax=Glossina austeni TaxID=7395 RepID=A0A1A9UKC1_GLOAU